MRRLFFIAVILCLCLTLFTGTTFAQDPFVTKRIGVLELENKSRYPGMGGIAADAVFVHLLRTQTFEVMDRALLEEAFKQRGTQPKGIVDPVFASSIGNAMGLDYILMGTVSKVNYTKSSGYWQTDSRGIRTWVNGYEYSDATVDIAIIDVKTAQIAYTTTVNGHGNTANVLTAIEDAGFDAAAAAYYKYAPIQGAVSKVENDKVYIDIGKASGIKLGDHFIIVKSAAEEAADTKKGRKNIFSVLTNKDTSLKVIEINDQQCVALLKHPNKKYPISPGRLVNKRLERTHAPITKQNT
jgi:hypothetical protein